MGEFTPTADTIMAFLRRRRDMFAKAIEDRKEFGVRPDLDHIAQAMILQDIIVDIERAEDPQLDPRPPTRRHWDAFVRSAFRKGDHA